MTEADKKLVREMVLPSWIDRAKDIKKAVIPNALGVDEEVFTVEAELPAHLRRDAKHFQPLERVAAPVWLDAGQSVEISGTYYVTAKAGTFCCRRVWSRVTKRDVLATRGTAVLTFDREATEAHDKRYWRDAREATARP